MEKTIKDSGSSRRVTKDQPPFAWRSIAGHDSASTLIPLTNELEEQSRALSVEGKVSQLIDDQKFKFLKLVDLMDEGPVLLSFPQDCN